MKRALALGALFWLGQHASALAQDAPAIGSPEVSVTTAFASMDHWPSSATPPTPWLNPALVSAVEPGLVGAALAAIVIGYGGSLAVSFVTASGCERYDYLRIPLVGGIATAVSFGCYSSSSSAAILVGIGGVETALLSILQIVGTILSIASGFIGHDTRATGPRGAPIAFGRDGLTLSF